MHYEGQQPNDTRYAMGTGWLIRPDLLVTAGHCAFDWSQNSGRGFRRATEVKAYIGYNGKESINSPNVQFRTGVKIVTTEGWLRSGQNRHDDVAFIQLNEPFSGISPLQYAATPETGAETIGVVGYPGDKRYNELKNGELGAQMYQEFRSVNWNLQSSVNGMLEYQISTYKGILSCHYRLQSLIFRNRPVRVACHPPGPKCLHWRACIRRRREQFCKHDIWDVWKPL
jgi:V8-like Glu-specific endopeptidase